MITNNRRQLNLQQTRWTGHRLIGGTDNTILHVARHTQRCAVINTDPATGHTDPEVFPAIRDQRKNRLGVYATALRTGQLNVGDTLGIHR